MGAQDVDKAPVEEAEALLESPDLLPRLEDFIEANGLIGEEVNRRLILLSGIGGHLGRPIHVIVKGPSSGGKNNLVNTSLSPLPPQRVKRAAHVSEKALSRVGELDGVLLVEEAQGQQAAEYAIRVAMSEGQVGNLVSVPTEDGGWDTEMIEADIAASIITTTTSPSLHAENQTRVFDVEIDASRELTRKVVDSIWSQKANGGRSVSERERRVVETATALLEEEEKEILIPWGEVFAPYFPADALRARRDSERVACLIEASALLYQRQRERDPQGHLLADVEDYRVVYPVLEEVLEQSMTGLTATARDLCDLHDELAEETESGWVRRPDLVDLARERGVATHNTVKDWCRELSEMGIWDGEQWGGRNTWHHRKIRDPDTGAINLPAPDELAQEVES